MIGSYDSRDQTYEDGQWARMPKSTRLLVIPMALISVVGLCIVAVRVSRIADGWDVLTAAAGGFATLAAVTAVGLWRAWPAAWYLTIVSATAVATMGMSSATPRGVLLGLIGAGDLLWPLTRPETRWWLSRD